MTAGTEEYKELDEGANLKKRTRVYFWIMNSLYAVVLGIAVFWLRPVCRDAKVYPYVFNFSAFLFILNCIYHYIIHSMDYGLTWFHLTLDEQKEAKKEGKVTAEIDRTLSNEELEEEMLRRIF